MKTLVTNGVIPELEKPSSEIERKYRRNQIYRETGRTVKGSTQFDCPLAKRNSNFDIRACRECNLQNISTSFDLCNEMIKKLKEYAGNFSGKSIIVFNMEFIEVLVYDFNVKEEQITFLTDCKHKKVRVNIQYPKVEVVVECFSDFLTGSSVMSKRQFDCVVMNPPYQLPKNIKSGKKNGTTGGDLWSKFVKVANEIVVEGGYVCAVHPPMWRKPEQELYPVMREKNMLYLEMHSEDDGRTTFKASTKYDWYLLQNNAYNGKTTIIDEMGEKHVFDLRDYRWLPCFGFDVISKILVQGKDKTCEVLYSRSEYGTDKPWMSDKETGEFKHPCVYSMTKDGFGCWYSSIKKDFAFGVPKVILGWGRYLYPLIDMEGKYGLSQNTFAIKVDSKKEAENIKRAIESDKFGEVLKATKWGAFQTEWRMFKYFRKDFWKEFVDENGNEI